jgi:hypothetical protein
MNSNRAEVSRKQLADTVKRRWGTLIERQLKLGEGKRDRPNQVAYSWITAKVQAATSLRSRWRESMSRPASTWCS